MLAHPTLACFTLQVYVVNIKPTSTYTLVSNEVKLFLRIILPSMKLPPILISCGKLSVLLNIRRDKSEMTDSIAIDSRKHNMDIEE